MPAAFSTANCSKSPEIPPGLQGDYNCLSDGGSPRHRLGRGVWSDGVATIGSAAGNGTQKFDKADLGHGCGVLGWPMAFPMMVVAGGSGNALAPLPSLVSGAALGRFFGDQGGFGGKVCPEVCPIRFLSQNWHNVASRGSPLDANWRPKPKMPEGKDFKGQTSAQCAQQLQ